MPEAPKTALRKLLQGIERIGADSLMSDGDPSLTGRLFAGDLCLDRDSPACDVSAMDGYAVRLSEALDGSLPVVGECPIGSPPKRLAPGTALRIYTGAPVPVGADTVVRIERATEVSGRLSLRADVQLTSGDDVRGRGENSIAGSLVFAAGSPLTSAAIGALATVGPGSVTIYRSLRVSVLATGNELECTAEEIPPWRLRDSNGPSLRGMLEPAPWVAEVACSHVADDLPGLTEAVASQLERSDAVVLTGGVSKGAYDFVPEAVRQAGCEQVFHRITARPGQPTLGAIYDGKPVIGLPGNPLAVLCAGRRLLVPALRQRAGFSTADPPVPVVCLSRPPTKTLPITWWRPVKLLENGLAEVVPLTGSGDVIGPAESDGFVECPPESAGLGPYPFYSWQP